MGKTIGVVLALKDKCSPQLTKIAEKMGTTEKEAKRLHKQAQQLSKELGAGFKKAGMVCAGVVGAVTVATQQLVSKTIEAGDNVDKMSQKIGMSRKSYQEWNYIMSQNGSSVDVLQSGYKKLASQMDGVRKGSKDSVATFKALGVSVTDSSGAFRNQEDVFNDTIRALQNIKNPTEKTVLATKLFGKSATELKPLLNQTAESVDGLRQKANDLGMVMSDETVDASVKLQDTLDTIQRSFSGLGVFIGSQFLPIVQSVSDKIIANMPQIKATITPIIDALSNTLGFLANHIDLVVAVATGLISTFVSFNVINGVIATISTLQKVIQLVTMAQGVWNAIMLANPIGAVALAIGGVIALITLLAMNWDKVTEVVKNFGVTVVDSIKTMFDKIKPIFEKIGEIIKTVFNFTPLGMAINGAKTLVNTFKKSGDDKEKPKKHALGTSYSSGGPAIVGEYGPELLNLKKGDSITPAPMTQQLLTNNSQKIEINVNIAGNMIGNNEFINQLKNALALELKTALATV